MASGSGLLGKISDRLENRDKQTNFGLCKRCEKKVYWSSSKVASHIRSGHCAGASEEEVQQFKQEFVYDTPKNLVHRTAVTKKFKENFEIEEYRVVKESPKSYARRCPTKTPDISPEPKRSKIELIEEYDHDDEIVYEDYNSPPDLDQSDPNGEEKLEIVFLPDVNQDEPNEVKHLKIQSSSSVMSQEDKFINAVYPQFKGKTRLELIEHILDLKRRNDMLQVKAKTYENTINRLLS